ncbi:MAG: AAA family ATPase [Candidatus Altiarchaeota archaeon]
MKITKVITDAFSIDSKLEKNLLKSRGSKIYRRYSPLAQFKVTRTEAKHEGKVFKKIAYDRKDCIFYVDLSHGDLYYAAKGRAFHHEPKLETTDLIRRMLDFPPAVVNAMGHLYEYGSLSYREMDSSVVSFLASQGLIEIYEPEANQLFNFIRYYFFDDRIMRKHLVRPTFRLPTFGNQRYNLGAFLDVKDKADDDYDKDPIRFSNESISEVLSILFAGSVFLNGLSYLPYIVLEQEKTGKSTVNMLVCSKGSKKVKKDFKTEVSLDPISFATAMTAAGSVPVESSTINFSHVANLKDVKEHIMQSIVYPLTHPELSKKYSRKGGGRILFYGPPGCGKTYIARATVGECGVNFFNVNTADIVSGGSEQGTKNIHEIFKKAGQNAPSIVFFDEIDALSGKRTEMEGSSRVLVNQFLTEMDGVENLSENVLIIGSTNIPWDLDPALRRAGRFTDQIFIPPPEIEAREEIFKIHTRKRPVAVDVDYPKLAELTEGYSSADIKTICDDALDIPWEEALKGQTPRKANMKDFVTALGQRSSSLTAWYKLAEKEIRKSGEENLFKDLADYILFYAGGVDQVVKPDITFSDVADLETAKDKIKKSVVYPLTNPELAKKFGKTVGGGILFYGPPGCGKTYLARATAGECHASFFSVSVTDVISGEEGESERNIKAAFERAARNAPSILFFDEIDAIAPRREEASGTARRLVNQFLTEMDGFVEKKGVMVIGSTNAPWDVDPALRRAGRFTHQVYVPNPNKETREAILKIHTRGKPVSTDVNFSRLAELTEGFSSADLKAVCDHALELPWEEAYRGGEEREANMNDFLASLRERKSSLPPWFKLAQKQLEESGEKDFYTDLWDALNSWKEVKPSAVDTARGAEARLRDLEREQAGVSRAIKDAKKRFKNREIDENAYKEMVMDSEKRLIDLEVDIESLKDSLGKHRR